MGNPLPEGFNKRPINEAGEGAAGLLEQVGAGEGCATPKAFLRSMAGGGDPGDTWKGVGGAHRGCPPSGTAWRGASGDSTEHPVVVLGWG